MGKRILFVDDERAILKALERLFFDCDYEIFTAESGEEGLQLLAQHPVDIVMSDMRMPGMDGHQFLKKVKMITPGTTRIILSGYADGKIPDGLIDGSSTLFLFKPWDSEDLKKKIAHIFEIRQIFRDPALLDIVNRMDNLSLITGIYTSICRLIDQEAEVSMIAKVIESDPVVTASVLRVANSAFYNVKTGSVGQAITFLGLPVLKSIVLSCSLYKSVNIKVPPFNIARLTRHTILTNCFVTQIYNQLLHKQLPDTLTTAGILHNIGLVLCLHYFPEKYMQMVRACSEQSKKLFETEKEMIGITNHTLGGYLLNLWSIPYPIVECALFHHEPLHSAVMDKEAVSVVHIAGHYAWQMIAPSLAPTLDAGVFSQLGITQQECAKLLHTGI